jgi:tRNA pseudouridine38-40 synthase
MEQGRGTSEERIALVVQYDGTCFNGWQIQKGGRTVQGEIENALHVLLRFRARATASGRTDSGVHALGQVIHCDVPAQINLQRICIGLNGILPNDIAVRNVYRVNDTFHSRFSAKGRRYRYCIHNHPTRTPFMLNRAMWVHERLDCEFMNETARHLIGEMDFASFCKKRESKSANTMRRITEVDIHREDDRIVIDIAGNAFLHNMVRIIVGTMVEMNKRKTDPGSIKEIIERRDRDYSGLTAPAYGLYLMKVEYDPPLEDMESAF